MSKLTKDEVIAINKFVADLIKDTKNIDSVALMYFNEKDGKVHGLTVGNAQVLCEMCAHAYERISKTDEFMNDDDGGNNEKAN